MSHATENPRIPSGTPCQPAFENLQQPSEKANWPRTPFFVQRVPDSDLLCQPALDLRAVVDYPIATCYVNLHSICGQW